MTDPLPPCPPEKEIAKTRTMTKFRKKKKQVIRILYVFLQRIHP